MTKGFEPYNNETVDEVDFDLKGRQTPDHARIQDHAELAYDFKGEATTFKATTIGLLTHLSHCVDLMNQSEETWRLKYERQIEKRKKLDEKYKQVIKLKDIEIAGLVSEAGARVPIGHPDFEEVRLRTSLNRIKASSLTL